MSDLKTLMGKMIEVANQIHRDSSCSANCIIIERTNPYYDDIKKIIEERK